MFSDITKKLMAQDSTHRTEQVVNAAPRIIQFIERNDYFDTPFSLDIDAHIITDGEEANRYLTEFISEEYGDFEEILNALQKDIDYPDDEIEDIMNEVITSHLMSSSKNYHNANQESASGVEDLEDTMWYQLSIFYYFYLLDEELPPTLEMMLKVYEHNGFPCGWIGKYPEGKLVVYSNNNHAS